MGSFLSVPKDVALFGLEFLRWRDILQLQVVGKCVKETAEISLTRISSTRRFVIYCDNFGVCDIAGLVVTMRRLEVRIFQVCAGLEAAESGIVDHEFDVGVADDYSIVQDPSFTRPGQIYIMTCQLDLAGAPVLLHPYHCAFRHELEAGVDYQEWLKPSNIGFCFSCWGRWTGQWFDEHDRSHLCLFPAGEHSCGCHKLFNIGWVENEEHLGRGLLRKPLRQ